MNFIGGIGNSILLFFFSIFIIHMGVQQALFGDWENPWLPSDFTSNGVFANAEVVGGDWNLWL